jgi:hypothetical protein
MLGDGKCKILMVIHHNNVTLKDAHFKFTQKILLTKDRENYEIE